ncbi:hypothetical protein [Microbacterium oleivorans]|uniref:hypothetical protein n=1 Tax=Microbacterium oleivorans TaxID=273677 RepID=UPI00203AD74B|nr:hypothetical protein [Microbacterium oleivorans]MCM3695973.1 hypothetical protein [Microbacterium oleivorans]
MSTHTQSGRGTADVLGLSSVLVGSLPAGLLTAAAPERYTVHAVFDRRPNKAEIDEIVGDDTVRLLADAGYGSVTLTVADRRLEIHDTTLEELHDGLAAFLADRLADISTDLRAQQAAVETRTLDLAARENDRAAAVATLAATVSFERSARLDDNLVADTHDPAAARG